MNIPLYVERAIHWAKNCGLGLPSLEAHTQRFKSSKRKRVYGIRFGRLNNVPVVRKALTKLGDFSDFYIELAVLLYTYQCPNIVQLVAADLKKRRLYLEPMAMDLDTLMEKKTFAKMGFMARAALARDIVYGLDQLHKCNIVHRDLKPENVLVRRHRQTRQWVAKLCDFNLASSFGDRRQYRPPRLPVTNALPIGNLLHKAPEIIPYSEWHDETRYATPKTDVMALAIVWWSLFIGKQYDPPDAYSAKKTFIPYVIEDYGRPSIRRFLKTVSKLDSMAAAYVRNIAMWLVQMWSHLPKRRLSTTYLVKAMAALCQEANTMHVHARK